MSNFFILLVQANHNDLRPKVKDFFLKVKHGRFLKVNKFNNEFFCEIENTIK